MLYILVQCEVVDAKQEFYQEVLENVKHYLNCVKQDIKADKDDFAVEDD